MGLSARRQGEHLRYNSLAMRSAIVAVLGCWLGIWPFGSKKKPHLPFVRVVVHLSSPGGHPVRNAGVVINQYSDPHWRQVHHPFQAEIKTNAKGIASINGYVPGIVLVQIIAHGYDTVGHYYRVNAPQQVIYIRLKSPQPQVSIYKTAKSKRKTKAKPTPHSRLP